MILKFMTCKAEAWPRIGDETPVAKRRRPLDESLPFFPDWLRVPASLVVEPSISNQLDFVAEQKRVRDCVTYLHHDHRQMS